MLLSTRLENRAEAWPARIAAAETNLPPHPTKDRTSATRAQLSTDELAFRIFAVFRGHPHINNVLTHISHANWRQVECALNSILDPATASAGLTPLAQNIIDLMCAERGVTGKILKPYFHAALYRLLEPSRAGRLIGHIEALFLELEWKAEHPAPTPALGEPSRESGNA